MDLIVKAAASAGMLTSCCVFLALDMFIWFMDSLVAKESK